MRHIDLFSGIGGFSLAAHWVWGDDHEIVAFCEKDPYCQKVLRKHWPSVPLVEDVNDLGRIVAYANFERRNQTGSQLERKSPLVEAGKSISECGCDSGASRTIDLLTGGFPCQPASCAGKRKGTEDDRWLWPQMLAAIRATVPRWIVAENVPGLLSLEGGLVFERVCLDLEDAGYEVWQVVLPACGQNAPHRRDRVWIVAHSKSKHDELSKSGGNRNGESQEAIGNINSNAANPNQSRPQEREVQRGNLREKRETAFRSRWSEHWYEAAARLCMLDDGLPGRLVRPKGWRVNALRALGNSIVPQVAYQIMMAINECMKEES
jgi:DNA (cytosine-5)-methyltransferase 1